MAFPIEIITTEKQLIQQIHLALQPLNQVQREFSFRMASERLLEEAFYFRKTEYTLKEIFDWLRELRIRNRGHMPYIILITGAGLSGIKLNLYGGHKASEGLAVFTMDAFDTTYEQFLFDKIRFIRYFIVRYSLSFITPSTKNHPDRGCMFDEKIDKTKILLSLSNGRICPECERDLKKSSLCNIDVESALTRLRQVVSNTHPVALVMKGGGVKGLALVGAMLELEKYFAFDTFAGTSAGAIAATLLGAGYKPDELEEIFRNKNFKDFLDNKIQVVWNFFTKFALHTGDHVTDWLNDLLKGKLNTQVSTVKMKDFRRHNLRTVIYANRVGEGPVTFDSDGENQDYDAAYATRCSMSIPFFFQPTTISGVRGYDGGMGNNFPLRKFITENQKTLFIGLYLKSKIKHKRILVNDMIDIATDSDERKVVDENRNKIVVIDPMPIETTQFSISDREKDLLVLAGRLGALEYLHRYHQDYCITAEDVQILNKQVEAIRAELKTSRFNRFISKSRIRNIFFKKK